MNTFSASEWGDRIGAGAMFGGNTVFKQMLTCKIFKHFKMFSCVRLDLWIGLNVFTHYHLKFAIITI